MSRKLGISRLDQRLLWTLEEPGALDLCAVVNALLLEHRDRDPESFLSDIGRSLGGLVAQGYVRVCPGPCATQEKCDRVAEHDFGEDMRLSEIVQWNPKTGRCETPGTNWEEIPRVEITEKAIRTFFCGH